MPLQLDRPLVVFDIEATGISPTRDRIVELSLLKVHPGGARESWTERFHPQMPIPAEATAIHGISDADVADRPPFSERAPEVMARISGCDLAGYNANYFDLPLLVEEFLRAGLTVDEEWRCVDVLRVFTRMEPRTLSAAYQFYCGKKLEGAHGAEADTAATWEVLQGQLERYGDALPERVEELAAFTTDREFVDYGRRMIWVDGVEVFHFGKHKGKPVEEVLRREPSYYDWMMRGDFAEHTKAKLRSIRERLRAGG